MARRATRAVAGRNAPVRSGRHRWGPRGRALYLGAPQRADVLSATVANAVSGPVPAAGNSGPVVTAVVADGAVVQRVGDARARPGTARRGERRPSCQRPASARLLGAPY